MTTIWAPSVADYDLVFRREQLESYPVMDAWEARLGYAVDRGRLEAAARVLACPVKVHPPNWQHGRLLYALTRSVLADLPGPALLVDIGTAKGFSALCLEWARRDGHHAGRVVSIDVIDPASQSIRNTVAECDGPKSLTDVLAPWPETVTVAFVHDTGQHWLSAGTDQIALAFIDGKHTTDAVLGEGEALAARQAPGAVVVIDDLQIPGVRTAVERLARNYLFERVDLLPHRGYAIGWRR